MPGSPPLAARARRADFQRTRQRILEAARALMAERGPESLTVSAVAHAAGINRTTAYQHFRTRDELVAAVTAEVIQEIGARIAEPRGSGFEDACNVIHIFRRARGAHDAA